LSSTLSAFGMGSFFIYLANSSFVLIGHHGLTPMRYGQAFAFNAVAFIGVHQFTARLTARHGLPAVIRVTVRGFALSLGGLGPLNLAGVDRP
jgi:DHA1 family bicyclomycin/chloramphenicol resistance-like MFS transporter